MARGCWATVEGRGLGEGAEPVAGRRQGLLHRRGRSLSLLGRGLFLCWAGIGPFQGWVGLAPTLEPSGVFGGGGRCPPTSSHGWWGREVAAAAPGGSGDPPPRRAGDREGTRVVTSVALWVRSPIPQGGGEGGWGAVGWLWWHLGPGDPSLKARCGDGRGTGVALVAFGVRSTIPQGTLVMEVRLWWPWWHFGGGTPFHKALGGDGRGT